MCIYRPGFYAICPHCFNKTFHPHSPPPRVDRYFFRYDQEFLDHRYPHGLPRDIIACPCESEDMWLWDIHPTRRADAEFTRYCSRCLRRAREHADQTGSTPDWYSRDAGDNPGRIFFVDRRRLPRKNEIVETWQGRAEKHNPGTTSSISDCNSDSTEVQFHQANETLSVSSASTARQFYDADIHRTTEYADPRIGSQTWANQPNSDNFMIYTEARSPYYQDPTSFWDVDGGPVAGSGRWVIQNSHEQKQTSLHVWNEDGDDYDHDDQIADRTAAVNLAHRPR